jgi:hypothetical protein
MSESSEENTALNALKKSGGAPPLERARSSVSSVGGLSGISDFEQSGRRKSATADAFTAHGIDLAQVRNTSHFSGKQLWECCQSLEKSGKLVGTRLMLEHVNIRPLVLLIAYS